MPTIGMTGAQAVAEIQQGLGWRSDKATEILAALNWVQDLRESGGRTLPWFMVTEDYTITTTSTTQSISLPAGFIKEVEEKEGNLRYQPTVGGRTFFLPKMNFEDAEKYFFGDWQNNFDLDTVTTADSLSPGFPRAYVLRANSIRIYPLPDDAYSLSWSFYTAQDDITAGETFTNGWLVHAPWAIVGGAGAKLAADIENQAAVQKYAAIAAQAEQNLLAQIVERAAAGKRLRMGSRL